VYSEFKAVKRTKWETQRARDGSMGGGFAEAAGEHRNLEIRHQKIRRLERDVSLTEEKPVNATRKRRSRQG